MELLTDGQHRHGGEKLNCFFCSNPKEHCQLFTLKENPDDPPVSKMLYNQKFVICPECDAKGSEYIAKHLMQWVKVQTYLNQHGIGLPEIEEHKKTGKIPKFNKRKKRK